MKTCVLLTVAAMTLVGLAHADPLADTSALGGGLASRNGLTDDQLDNLVAPMALYPDTVVALVLDACQHASALVSAGDYLSKGKNRGNPDPTWPPSVKALLRYPAVLTHLDDQMSWTVRLGNAVKADSGGVNQAIQRVRARARAAGNLMSNQYQNVVVVNNVIEIEPASSDVVYIPSYDSSSIYTTHSTAAPLLTFGAGVALGAAVAHIDNDYYHNYYNHIYGGGAVHYGGYYGGATRAVAVGPYVATGVSHIGGPYRGATHVGHVGPYGYHGATHVGGPWAGATHFSGPRGGATFGHVGNHFGGFGHGFGGGGFHFHGRR